MKVLYHRLYYTREIWLGILNIQYSVCCVFESNTLVHFFMVVIVLRGFLLWNLGLTQLKAPCPKVVTVQCAGQNFISLLKDIIFCFSGHGYFNLSLGQIPQHSVGCFLYTSHCMIIYITVNWYMIWISSVITVNVRLKEFTSVLGLWLNRFAFLQQLFLRLNVVYTWFLLDIYFFFHTLFCASNAKIYIVI